MPCLAPVPFIFARKMIVVSGRGETGCCGSPSWRRISRRRSSRGGSIAWPRLARDLPMNKLDVMTSVVRLDDRPEASSKILKGQIRGCAVVDACARALLHVTRVFCYS